MYTYVQTSMQRDMMTVVAMVVVVEVSNRELWCW